MPYITKNTFFNLVKDIDLKKEPNPSKARLEGRNLTILSKKEMQRLAAISELLKSENIEVNRFFKKIEKPVDTLNYITPEKSPSYHFDINCKALTREYENYKIPEEVRALGTDFVNKFRKFFVENKILYKNEKIKFLYLAKKEFNLQNLPEDIVEVKAPNSGHGAIMDFDLSTLEDILDNSIKEAENFKNLNPTNRLTINKYGNIFLESEINDINENEQGILKTWRTLKSNLKSNYIKYCTIKYNSDFNLNGGFLSALGLKPCSFCQENGELIEFTLFSKPQTIVS